MTFTELNLIDHELTISNTREELVINALPDPSIIVDKMGTILATNSLWEDSSKPVIGLSDSQRAPDNYFSLLNQALKNGNDYALKMILGFRDLAGGRKKSFSLEYNIRTGPSAGWYRARVSPVDEYRKRYLVMHESINKPVGSDDLIFENRATNATEQFHCEFVREKMLSDTIISSQPGAFFLLDGNGNILRWNEEMEIKFGYPPEEAYEKHVLELVHPNDRKRAEQNLKEVLTSESTETELKIQANDGSTYLYRIKARQFSYLDENYIVGSGIDITEGKKAIEELEIKERKLLHSLQEKNILLQEVHHRVKNNLAVVSGLLEMQSEVSEQEEVRTALTDSKMRIFSMAKIHELLYRHEDLHEINLSDYIRQFTEVVSSTYCNKFLKLNYNYELVDVGLNINQAVPCAMILNEIVTNAVKHAFEGQKEGEITFRLTKEDTLVTIAIADNGNGLPDDLDLESSKSLGITLIKTLVKQLDGDLSISSSDKGTEFRFTFALQNYNGPSRKLG